MIFFEGSTMARKEAVVLWISEAWSCEVVSCHSNPETKLGWWLLIKYL